MNSATPHWGELGFTPRIQNTPHWAYETRRSEERVGNLEVGGSRRRGEEAFRWMIKMDIRYLLWDVLKKKVYSALDNAIWQWVGM